MNRKIILTFFSMAILVVLGSVYIIKSPSPGEVSLKIINQTDKDIDELLITYNNDIENGVELPIVYSNDELKYLVDVKETSTEEFYEGSMELTYLDSSQIIIPYFGETWSGEVIVVINSIENNQLDITIEKTVQL
ncbi:hypothetical protein AJ85_00775 [Alkalihalobacillus alcalophilus ATCC 27647 = CGMCC 1.3604]|uniref:Uncharacterized protein n=1 Tax=Alkalihalobacillus alcalophilus ATCC 27647 = CGMCC 1.3604 TaxID=1218173 RepID=A0A094WNG2_ALKAL|nr:hypothetical protein [Alkalihalobacillus alcalophilus]KGA97513.1 hypothetical protein BALCAV_0209665 [Alkalihalobacillus alcalophilus ATCC 27647 = CGMCC 1.3604]MED1560764.1 hypothetical protein [Alkalihalobacillus alcalophilus]THG91922.1 hypothetical protein AJ85_00775 [Alkalihalobacillus alcalophilus ATCC 27647 = CGMCC 1.3604]